MPRAGQDTEAALTQRYRYAEARAIDAIDWYLADKRGKRIWSGGLRLVVILLVTAGALQPLLRVVSDDMAALIQQETAEWVLEFQSNLLGLETSTGGSWSSTRGRTPRRPRGRRVAGPAGEGSPAQPATLAGR